MKILLDENIDVRFRHTFDTQFFEVYTVRYMGWNGLKNGELLHKMNEETFDVFIAVDKNLPYQQDANNLPVTIIILDVKKNILSRLQSIAPKLFDLLSDNLAKSVYIIGE
jgi:hypothetical protein